MITEETLINPKVREAPNVSRALITKKDKKKKTKLKLNSWVYTPDEKRFGLALEFLARDFNAGRGSK